LEPTVLLKSWDIVCHNFTTSTRWPYIRGHVKGSKIVALHKGVM